MATEIEKPTVTDRIRSTPPSGSCSVQVYVPQGKTGNSMGQGDAAYFHIILTFMRYMAAKWPVSNDFGNAFRTDPIAEVVTRILRLYKGSKGKY